MKLAFDTSVLMAAVVQSHPQHERARPWVQAATSGNVDALISWHAAAETWSVLTRLPGVLRLTPATAEVVLDRLLEHFRPIALAGAVYRKAIRRCAECGVRSGALFDALHLVVAESEESSGLVTFNRLDFERLRRSTSPPIWVPPDPPAFDPP